METTASGAYERKFGLTDEGSLALAAMVDPEGNLRLRSDISYNIGKPSRVWLDKEEDRAVLRYEVPANYMTLPLRAWGWQQVQNTQGLVEQFVRVRTAEQAVTFAENWGPLWALAWDRSSGSDFLSFYPKVGRLEDWRACEPVAWWEACAAEARAALHIIAALKQDPPQNAALDDIEHLWYWADTKRYPHLSLWRDWALESKLLPQRLIEPEKAQFLLVASIHRHILHDPAASRLWLTWDSTRLQIEPGSGFIRAVWQMIAQLASRSRAVYQCADCGEACVLPQGARKRPSGRRNYCAACAENRRGTKKLVAREHRGLLRRLVDFVADRTTEENPDWGTILEEWNVANPANRYESVEAMLAPLRKRSYNIAVPPHLAQLLSRLPPGATTWENAPVRAASS
jgi:hypothetical protein